MKKEDYLNQLRTNDVFKDLLSRATSDSERRAIKAYAEDFLMKILVGVVDPVAAALEKDPEVVKKAYLEIESDLITNSSGSADS